MEAEQLPLLDHHGEARSLRVLGPRLSPGSYKLGSCKSWEHETETPRGASLSAPKQG